MQDATPLSDAELARALDAQLNADIDADAEFAARLQARTGEVIVEGGKTAAAVRLQSRTRALLCWWKAASLRARAVAPAVVPAVAGRRCTLRPRPAHRKWSLNGGVWRCHGILTLSIAAVGVV